MGGLIAYRQHAHQLKRSVRQWPVGSKQSGRIPAIALAVPSLVVAAMLALALILMLGVLGGCSTLGFYQQAVVGQMKLLRAREDVDKLLASAELEPALRSALLDSQAAVKFAESRLGLAANGRYGTYVELEQPYVVWNLVVTPVDSVTPRTWCFPVAGCVSYRGYFDESRAKSSASQFESDEFDTFVGGVPAYSTLGWFDDPLLSSFIYWPQPARVELLFHELAHGRLYVAGDTPFNESFATFVAGYALPRYLEHHSQTNAAAAAPSDPLADTLALHRARKAQRARFNALQLRLRDRIAADFAALNAESVEQAELAPLDRRKRVTAIRTRRYAEAAACFRAVSDQFVDSERLLAVLLAPPNLARLSLIGAYHGWLDAFAVLFSDNEEDLERFYEAAEALTTLSYEDRQLELQRLAERSEQQIKPDGDHQDAEDIQCEALTNHPANRDVSG